MLEQTSHKERAIDLHTEQAGEFDLRYRNLAENPYRSTFTYGRKKIEEFMDRILASRPKGQRALDVGCGTGFNVARLKQRGFDVVGVEPASGMRQRAQENNPGVEILAGDIEHIPLPNESVDVILCIEVIRYLADPAKGLREMARVLRPGGIAIITAAPLLSLNGFALINQVSSRLKLPTFTKFKHKFVTSWGAKNAALEAGFSGADVHGIFLGAWHALGRVSEGALSVALKTCEPLDEILADAGPLKDLSNHLVIVARK